MGMKRIALFTISALIYAAIGIYGADATDESNAPELKPDQAKTTDTKSDDKSVGIENTKLSGDISMVEGQIVKGYGTSGVADFAHAWISTTSGILRLETNFNEHTQLFIEAGADILFSYTIPINIYDKEFAQDQKLAKFGFWLKQAKGSYNFGDPNAETTPLKITLGEYEYKYNPDVRNLGEYLLRASAYPNYFNNWFDGACYRVAGLQATTHPVDWFNFDALFFSELYLVPLQDFSLAGIATFKLGKVMQIGAGIDLNKIFSIDERYTTPKTGAGGKVTDNIYSQEVDSLGQGIPGTQKYYSFKATKIEIRGTFDIKGFFDAPIFGPEDLKLYSEAAILGLQNYPTHNPGRPDTYYANMSQRVPVMVGFNFPAFKVLDVASLELEYYHSPYLPSYVNPFKFGIPVPDYSNSNLMGIQDTKWSVYLKKRIGAFAVTAQAARDHFQPLNTNIAFTEFDDVMMRGSDWWWAVKLQYGY
jgi:hypothetical protein